MNLIKKKKKKKKKFLSLNHCAILRKSRYIVIQQTSIAIYQHNKLDSFFSLATGMNTNNSQFMMSVYATKAMNRKRKKLSDNENDGNQSYQPNSKRQKIEFKVPQLEKIVESHEEDDQTNKENDLKCNLNDEKKNEEKKNEEVNEDNVWKKSRKIRRQYFCANFPTLVITPVKGRMLLSASSLIRFMNIDPKFIRPKIKAHTHSASWRTLYVHLSKSVQISDLEEISNRFNDIHSNQIVQNLSKDEDDEVHFVSPKCCIFQQSYQEEAKKKRIENKKKFLNLLAEYKYNIQDIQRFKGLPIVKVLMSSAEDVKRILSDNNIFIGYRQVQCEIYDQNRRRPRKSFKQCRKCYGLNHIANECNKKPVCKYCGRINHCATQCKFKKSPKKHHCVLCKGNHRSDSLICPKTKDIRQKLGISFTRRENEIINRKMNQINNHNQKDKTTAVSIKINPNKQVNKQAQDTDKQKLSPNQNNSHKKESKDKLESVNNFGVQNYNKNTNKKDNANNYSYTSYKNDDEMSALRAEVASLKNTVEKLSMFIDRMMPLMEQNSKFGGTHYSNNALGNASETTDGTMDQWQNTDYHFQYLYNHYWSETGRTGILCRRDIHSTKRLLCPHPYKFDMMGYESCWIEISYPGQNKPLLFCSIYRNIQKYEVNSEEDRSTFNNKAFYLREFEKELVAARKISDHIIIGGDWNAHHPAWLDKNVDEIGEAILNFIISNNLHILNTYPFDYTYFKENCSSCIDITLCSASLAGLCCNWRTDDYELDAHSDHLPITFNILAQWAPQHVKRQKVVTWNLSNNNWELFRQYLTKNLTIWTDTLMKTFQNSPEALDQAVESWSQHVVNTGKVTIGQKITWKGNKPWWSNKLQKLRKNVHQLKRNFRKYRTTENYERYKEAARSFKRILRCEKQIHITKSIESLHEGNIRQMFCQFRSLNSNKIAIIPSLTILGKDGVTELIAEADIDKANLLANWFAQPPQPPKSSNEDDGHYEYVEDEICSVVQMSKEVELSEYYLIDKWHQSEITEEEVIEAIRHVSAYKSQGPDNIHNLMLKNGGQSLINSLVLLFGWSYKIGYFPKAWKIANIVAIPKPDRDPTICKNYRPISLLSCVGKLMERIITMRLTKYLNENQMLHQSQAGFQSWHNTSELLLRISESIHTSFDKNGVTYAAMLDISAAYDSVWRDGLRFKMRHEFKLHGRLYWWIDSFLSERVGQVVLNGISSSIYNFDTGVPQGSSLSPLLFLLYINDISQEVHEPIQCGMFADDVALWTSIYTSKMKEMDNQLQLLQQSLDGILLWASKWKLLLSPEKSQCITFRKKNKRNYPLLSLHLGDAKIPETNKVKYLGLIMDSHLTYKEHVNYVYGKASRKLGYLTFLCSYKGIRPSMNVYNLLYKTIIRPNLEYACAFWNGAAESHKKKLERIQRIAMCRILGVMQSSAYDTVNIIAQVPPLELRRQQEEVKLFQRCEKYMENFPRHNLSQSYQLWKNNHQFKTDEYFCWLGKLSTLSRACINIELAMLHGINMDHHLKPFQKIPANCLTYIPHPIKSPFDRWSEPTPSQILSSLDETCVVIFTDGSTMPNPGIGGVGLVIQDNSMPKWIELQIPIQGITTSIGSEIESIKTALEYTLKYYQNKDNRVIIMNDCKFAVNAITNKWDAEMYKKQVDTCQKIMLQMGSENVPEIYWIKGHSGIPGNEKADEVAKKARQNAQSNQPGLYQRPDKSASFLNADGLGPYFTLIWNRHWTNEGNEDNPHAHPKKFLRNLIDAQSFEKIVLHQLEVHERRTICRVITGKVGLNYYLHKINRANAPECSWCGNEPETVEHFLMKCPRYNDLRMVWHSKVVDIIPELDMKQMRMRKLVIGDRRWPSEKRVKIVKELARFVAATKRKL
ncbi:hypothetical protein RFI_24849 [Reticulomyxa filosa]|uniref:Reverse transcriptase domain-containing protein n=1 Tax=Reticulomyxa filosa TaxID=46433 RepID=X6MFS7_RETFI|nr:hypothetical protein RFI_24849 [Reticulomyxa filosa]|eukprot:ETO12526.1 hypothetical protein RFI_24849 [Reticulomyxa filosa]